MEIVKYPLQSQWESLTRRPQNDTPQVWDTVREILAEVKTNGDSAVKAFSLKFDKTNIENLAVSESEILAAIEATPKALKDAIALAAANIACFHTAQKTNQVVVETMPGVTCRQKAVAIQKVGLYIPGGTAPLFSTVLMLAIPAQIAGCSELVLCTPPDANGKINPAILFAATLAGVAKIYKIGGVQAIAAMAYGTESVPKVYKIFGPGNQYVTAAKQLVSLNDVAIDMPAGPSEVEVLADETANAAFVASDLLSQAEHGTTSQVFLVTTCEAFIPKLMEELEKQLAVLPRAKMARVAIENSRIVVVKTLDEAIALTNLYAPEHLIVAMDNYKAIEPQIINAGSVFLGHFTPESAGDYASGTNHTLPTNGFARMYSGVNLDSFQKKITFQEITEEGIENIGATVALMAEAEQLFAHQNAMILRMESIKNKKK